LASASPARLATLQAAGIDPLVQVSDLDEAAVLAGALARDPALAPAGQVTALARAKAEAAAPLAPPGALVLGCDSMLELDGEVLGKPRDAADARRRIRQQSGRAGVLHTGHWLLGPALAVGPRPAWGAGAPSAGGADRPAGAAPGAASPAGAPPHPVADHPVAHQPGGAGRRGEGAASSTVVRFGDLTEAEIEAYAATGEPLAVAGAFTIDGLGGPFIEGLEGDHHGVVGLSLPVLRHLLARFGVAVFDLWRPELRPDAAPRAAAGGA
jgi:septum formation protein